jgi:NitT/TauT family transport system substrate-binding protein
MSKIRAPILLAAMSMLTGVAFFGNRVAAQDVVRVGVGVDPVYTAWWVAADKGFFAKRNLNVTLRQYSGGPDLADSVMAGEQDFGASGTATWMPRFVRSDALIIVARMATSPSAYNMAALTSIKSLEDLKGKKVGTVGGSSTDYLWALVAKKLGVPEDTFNLVPVAPPELVPALDRGDVQAFFCWEPWPSKAVEISGKDKVHLLASSGDVGYFLNFIVVANKKFAELKPDVTARVLAALRDAIDYMNSNKADAIKIGAESNKLTPKMAEYIINFYKFKLDLPDKAMVGSTKVEEAWMRGKNRLKGEPINWDKTIDGHYFDMAMKLR